MSDQEFEQMKSRLNAALIKSGLSIPEIVKRIEVTDKGVRKWFSTGRIATKRIKPLAKILGCDHVWLATGESFTGVREFDQDFNKSERDVMISVYDVQLSAGNGMTAPEYIETKKQLPFDSQWLQKHRLKPKDLKVLYVAGDSMIPTMEDGDSVLIDTSKTKIIDRKIYAIVIGGECKIKRLSQRFDGSVQVISDNPQHQTETIQPHELEHLFIIGQAVYRSGMI